MAQEESRQGIRGQDGDQQQHHKFSSTSATRRAGQFKCVGAIRKAGFLSVKKWILKRRQSIELARKQGWKRYWVCLRGTALLFHSVIETTPKSNSEHIDQISSTHQPADYELQENQTDLLTWIQKNCSSQFDMVTNLLRSENNQDKVSRDTFVRNMSQCYIEKEPRHLIIIDGAIAQPIPEHPRRDFIFCLSTTFGDAYLFQAGCQLESDNWITATHNACAASIARDLVRDEAIKLFETKIRHFELEAEKKLFLRHRLESRLVSMSSMCHISKPSEIRGYGVDGEEAMDESDHQQQVDKNRMTMRSLLYQLSQQLSALDTYIEQLHCEVYQMRCYLSSCGAQNIFYQNLQHCQSSSSSGGLNLMPPSMVGQNDLPHPKSLLMHVSKPTKLLLIKLGVFTVSSFHAYIHARQESAKTILETIHQQQSSCPTSPIVELRIRSHSISESFLSKGENVKLANETESLIELANLKRVPILLCRSLSNKIKRRYRTGSEQQEGDLAADIEAEVTSDDRFSIQDHGDFILLNVKLNPSSNSSSIIEQVLKIIEPNSRELDFLDYYLRLILKPTAAATTTPGEQHHRDTKHEDFFVVKKKETLEDWTNYVHIELLEKIVFRVELTRSRMEEEESGSPFGVSVEGQLVSSKTESLLNVYCSYIEWGSAADKAGLQDEDEFLMINGVPVGDLDLMFVESIIQDANKLRLVVRSNRCECPSRAKRLDQATWRSLDGDDGNADGERDAHLRNGAGHFRSSANGNNNRSFVSTGSQVISDDYLTSLVCPPPPAKSSAFLRTNTNLLRQKSDLGPDSLRGAGSNSVFETKAEAANVPSNHALANMAIIPKSKSHHRIDSSMIGRLIVIDTDHDVGRSATILKTTTKTAALSSEDLARQLLQRTERLTKLLGKEPIGEADRAFLNAQNSQSGCCNDNSSVNQNHAERLKKSILELIETEYAYIRHLETISEHYMAPLREAGFLNITDLRSFDQTVRNLLKFQHQFFAKLATSIFNHCCTKLEVISAGSDQQQQELNLQGSDEFERFNRIVQSLDSFKTVNSLKPLRAPIAKVFLSEIEKFKTYSSYCVAYSRLQRLLHPKKSLTGSSNPSQCPSTITSIPTSLNTFSSSLVHQSSHMASLGNFAMQPIDLKLLSATGKQTPGLNGDQAAQLRQLADFLANLDSSSSSASFSLPPSSSSEKRPSGRMAQSSKATVSSGSANEQNDTTGNNANAPNYQKSVHQQNFESYLIKPIQRIVKYPLLLNSIALAVQQAQTYKPEELSSSHDNLQEAIKQMETLVNHVNDMQRVHDEYGIVFDHIERQFFEQQAIDVSGGRNNVALLFGPHQPPITLNIAQLLHFGPVEWLNVAEFTSKAKRGMNLSSVLFVFESCVIFMCKEQIKVTRRKIPSKKVNENALAHHQQQRLTSRMFQWSTSGSGSGGEQVTEIVRYQTLIPVSEVQVRSVPAEATNKQSAGSNSSPSSLYQWELFQCSSSNSNSSLLTKSSSKQLQQQQRNNSGKVYLLCSRSNEERITFLRKIRLTIRESVRNMSLPPTSHKSLTSPAKKLSTSSASSATSNTNININTSTSLSPPESSGGPELLIQDQSTAIKCEPYKPNKQVHETSIEVKT